jgi:hypothetical protein
VKFTASAAFEGIARGASKLLTWRIYARKTSDLTGTIVGTSGWTDITDRIDLESMPDIASRIEYGVGEFGADPLTLRASGVQYFKSNFLHTNARDPRTIPNLRLWLKADAIQNLIDGDAVAAWSDISGNGWSATQSTAGSRPTYKTNILNGQPVVRFDGGDHLDFNNNATPLFSAAGEWTLFVVHKISTTTGTSGILGQYIAAVSNGRYYFYDAGSFLGSTATLGSVTQTNGAESTTTTRVDVHRRSASNRFRTYSNGVNNDDDTDASTRNLLQCGNILGAITSSGSVYNGAMQNYYNGDIAEVILFNRDLTDAELLAVQSYLGTKYGRAISGGYSDDPVEVKAVCTLDGASEICYQFSGWVKKETASYDELTDSVEFTAGAANDLMERMPAEYLSTRYIEDSVETAGTGTDGLILQLISGLFLTSANVTSYVAKVGVHTITYEYNGGTWRAKLDNGAWVNLAVGSNTLGNAATAGADTERVTVYVRATADLPTSAAAIEEEFIVRNAGETLPYQWYRYGSLRQILAAAYTQAGITTQTFDTLEIPTYNGGGKISFVDFPPASGSYNGYKWAICSDGTDIWMGVGNYLFKRTTSTGAYTLKATLTAGQAILKLMYNARNGHIWLLHQGLAAGTGYISRFIVSSDTLSAATSIGSRVGNLYNAQGAYSCEIVDYNYTGSSYKYGLAYVDPNGPTSALKFLDGSALTIATIVTETGKNPFNVNFLFIKTGNYVYFTSNNGATHYMYRVHVDAAGAWVDDGLALTLTEGYSAYCAAYDSANDRIVYWNGTAVRSHTSVSATTALILTPAGGSSIESFYYGNSLVYFTEKISQTLYSVSTGTAATVLDTGVHNRYNTFVYVNSRLYGLDTVGRLYQYHTSMALYVPTATFTGQTIRDAVNTLQKCFHVIAKISMAKSVQIMLRSDSTGTPKTSGSTLSITVSDPSSIQEVQRIVEPVDFVSVSNETTTYTYDGITFNSIKYSTNAKSVEISCTLIPDQIIQHLAYHIYQFFKLGLNQYTIALGCLPLFQYEPLDGVSVTLTTTNIAKTATGPIYGTIASLNGSLTLEVLL